MPPFLVVCFIPKWQKALQWIAAILQTGWLHGWSLVLRSGLWLKTRILSFPKFSSIESSNHPRWESKIDAPYPNRNPFQPELNVDILSSLQLLEAILDSLGYTKRDTEKKSNEQNGRLHEPPPQVLRWVCTNLQVAIPYANCLVWIIDQWVGENLGFNLSLFQIPVNRWNLERIATWYVHIQFSICTVHWYILYIM